MENQSKKVVVYDIKSANKDGGGHSKFWYFKANIVNWTYVSIFLEKNTAKESFRLLNIHWWYFYFRRYDPRSAHNRLKSKRSNMLE